jgi:hypothetical protein
MKKTSIVAYRGIRGGGSDPGDFGRGIYWSTVKERAECYAQDGLLHEELFFSNPLIISCGKAYDMGIAYGTVGPKVNDDHRMLAAHTTLWLLLLGYDGLFSVRDDETEIVDYRPYAKPKHLLFLLWAFYRTKLFGAEIKLALKWQVIRIRMWPWRLRTYLNQRAKRRKILRNIIK